MAEKGIPEWVTEILKEYWINEERLQKLDQEMGTCRRKGQFWNSFIEYLESIDRGKTSYDIELVLEWCEEEKKKLSEELGRIRKETAKRDFCETLMDFFKGKAEYP